MINDYSMKIDGKNYGVVAETGQYDYEWHIVALLQDEEGNLFFASDSGCSCYGFGDDLTERNLTPVKHWSEAVDLARAEIDGYFLTDDEVAKFAERLMKA